MCVCVCVARPDPGDIIDEALKKCDVQESKCISFFILYFRDHRLCNRQFISIKSLSLYYLCVSFSIFQPLLAVSSRPLQPVHEGAASVSGSAPPVAMCPAVSQAL